MTSSIHKLFDGYDHVIENQGSQPYVVVKKGIPDSAYPVVHVDNVEYIVTDHRLTKKFVSWLADDAKPVAIPLVLDAKSKMPVIWEAKGKSKKLTIHDVAGYAVMNRKIAVDMFGLNRLTQECKQSALDYLKEVVDKSFLDV